MGLQDRQWKSSFLRTALWNMEYLWPMKCADRISQLAYHLHIDDRNHLDNC
jgi:hypothetical protein